MSRRANPTVIGAFVVGALVLIVIGVLVFGSGAVLRERVPVVAFFEGNVRGLQEGSAVEFRGVRVGTVKQIQVSLDVSTGELRIPVYMELDTGSLMLAGSTRQAQSADALPFLDQLVARGLRAQLDLKSFVTGQLTVDLDMHPSTQVTRVGAVAGVYELPTVPSTFDQLFKVLRDLPLQNMAAKLIDTLDKASQLLGDGHLTAALRDAAGTAANAQQLMSELRAKVGPAIDEARATMREARAALLEIGQHADTTLDEYVRLAHRAGNRLESLATKSELAVTELGAIRASLDARVAPVAASAIATLGEARTALANANSVLAEDSSTRYNLDAALEQLAAAARSIRIMADYLEQNPDALIKGKGY